MRQSGPEQSLAFKRCAISKDFSILAWWSKPLRMTQLQLNSKEYLGEVEQEDDLLMGVMSLATVGR